MSKGNGKASAAVPELLRVGADTRTLEEQVAAQKDAKALACGTKINELLIEYGCVLVPVATIEAGKISQSVTIRCG